MAFEVIAQEKLNQWYRGHAERCVYTFTVNLPDQLGASWQAKQHIEATITELQAQGALLLEYTLYEDKQSGTWTTDYKCDMVTSASPLWWNIIIVGVLALLSLIAVSYTITKVEDIVEYSPGTVIAGSVAVGLAALAAIILLARARR